MTRPTQTPPPWGGSVIDLDAETWDDAHPTVVPTTTTRCCGAEVLPGDECCGDNWVPSSLLVHIAPILIGGWTP